jgi:hypothetical protein
LIPLRGGRDGGQQCQNHEDCGDAQACHMRLLANANISYAKRSFPGGLNDTHKSPEDQELIVFLGICGYLCSPHPDNNPASA